MLVKQVGTLCSGNLDRPLIESDRFYIEDGVFRAIGVECPNQANIIIDAAGTTVLPGLIDGHVHPTAGEYTPAQDSVGWISNYVHGGTTTVVSAGELHHPGLAYAALTPDLVLSIATVARSTLGRLRPLGMRVEAGTLLLVPGLVESDFDRAANSGIRHVKFIFYDWSTGVPGEAERYVTWARDHDMVVKVHSGGVSRSGASAVAGYEVVARIRPDIVAHISGGPIPMPDEEIRRIILETDGFIEICSSMNYRATLVALEALESARALHRLTLGTDTPGGTGVIPRGMLRNLLFLSGVGGLPAAQAVAVATGNTGRAHRVRQGRIELGAPADFIICDRILGSTGIDALDSIQRGDLPGVSVVVIGGEVCVGPRSDQTPPPDRQAVITRAA